MLFHCCDDRRRRNEIAGRDDVNGIEFLEVLDSPALPDDERQRTLHVHFINDPTALGLTPENVRDRRAASASARCVSPTPSSSSSAAPTTPCSPSPSTGPATSRPTRCASRRRDSAALPGLDPLLRAVDFSFKVNCETTFDPLRVAPCPAEARTEPALDYLARDYASLRRLMLDRLALLLPELERAQPGRRWRRARRAAGLCRRPAQLPPGRGRHRGLPRHLPRCVPRHAATRGSSTTCMHDGCNARTWVQVRIAAGVAPFELRRRRSTASFPGCRRPSGPGPTSRRPCWARTRSPSSSMTPVTLVAEHDEMPSTPGAPASAACPAARPARRCAARCRTSSRGWCWSSRRCAARAPAIPTMPTSRTATPCA